MKPIPSSLALLGVAALAGAAALGCESRYEERQETVEEYQEELDDADLTAPAPDRPTQPQRDGVFGGDVPPG